MNSHCPKDGEGNYVTPRDSDYYYYFVLKKPHFITVSHTGVDRIIEGLKNINLHRVLAIICFLHHFNHSRKPLYYNIPVNFMLVRYELRGLWNPEDQCRIQKGSPVIPILSRINPIPRIDTNFFKIHSNTALPSLPRPS